MRNYYIFAGIFLLCIIGVVIAGLTISGNPIEQRDSKFDQLRLTDFTNIRYKIENYYTSNKKLPDKLTDVDATQLQDPETQKDYDYEISGATSYKLCTTFSTETKENKKPGSEGYSIVNVNENGHKKGYDCITYQLPDYLTRTPTPTSTPEPLADCRTFDNNVSRCDANGPRCAYYFCSNTCWLRGTPNSTACNPKK